MYKFQALQPINFSISKPRMLPFYPTMHQLIVAHVDDAYSVTVTLLFDYYITYHLSSGWRLEASRIPRSRYENRDKVRPLADIFRLTVVIWIWTLGWNTSTANYSRTFLLIDSVENLPSPNNHQGIATKQCRQHRQQSQSQFMVDFHGWNPMWVVGSSVGNDQLWME